ncbi:MULTISPECIES: response regulator transcription factor [Cetobacterium]|jgi:two-component system response regulator VicR|uniref:Response regulator transcription factor n=1 Tax=Candidatus Cetobacterium colombiensis TaxID=3073100 RepID=A0ABU4WC62_9FUSO|nr:response regulator transcription factor [Candidatus Cetobacterium colombiensis]MDX8336083.1 response regulator transcription factor [Candidatus Cetobacterium colombiensis]
MKRLLIIEDEKELALTLESHFFNMDIEIKIALDGKSGIEIFEEFKPDLVLLDINLPLKNGWEVCEYIRGKSEVPIIMMTARDSELDEIHGLEIGADDYIIKPFSINVLSTKIKKYLKLNNQNIYFYKELMYSFKDEMLKIDNERINLSTREKNLLEYFIKNKNKPLSRENILLEIWGIDNEFDERASDTLVKRLRKKLNKFESLIGTVRGVGYIFEER